MTIKRDEYLNKLIRYQHNGLIKVVTGIRRCGKTYLLCNIFYKYLLSTGINEDHIIRIAMDDRRNKALRDPDALLEYVDSMIVDKDQYYLIIDEVQVVDEFPDVLNSFLHIDNLDVYVTGSNAKFLSKDIVTEFRGRATQIHIYPLSFREFCDANKERKVEELWNEYVLYGGMPKILEFNSNTDKASYLKELFNETFIRDLIEHNNIQDKTDIEDLISVISSSIGSLSSVDKIANTFQSVKDKRISPATIKKYLEYMEDAFIVENVKRYDIKGRSYINSPSKFYFTDIGLRNACINFRQNEETHILENIVYNELVHRGYSVDVGAVKAYIPNGQGKSVQKQLEVDFVCNNIDARYYIQVALSMPDNEKIEQESRSLKKIEDSFLKMIITKDAITTYFNNDGILIVNLFDFLLNPSAIMQKFL